MNEALALRVQEALEDGDGGLAHALVNGEVDGSSVARDDAPVLLCPECKLDCVYPGRLEDHRRIVHWIVEEAA